MTPSASTNPYKHHRFLGEIISHAVWLYCRFCLGHRDVEKLLFVRGVIVSYEAMRKWCRKFGHMYANRRCCRAVELLPLSCSSRCSRRASAPKP